MNESTATDLRGLLSKESSIDFGGGNGNSQFLTIRGMGQNSVDIKVDNAYSDSQILYHQGRFIIDPSLLKSISVQKGAGSASAGIGATNGAIIAKTVDALDLLENSELDYGFKINSGFNSNDGITYGGTLFGKWKNFDALFSYSRSDEKDYKAGKGYSNVDGNNTLPYSGLDKRSYIIKLGATFDKHRFVLSHLQDQHRGIRLVREEFLLNTARLSLARQSPSYRETTLQNTNFEYSASDLGFIKKIDANAYFMRTKRYSADDSGCGYCGNVQGPTTTIIDTQGLNLGLDSQLGDNTLIKYGINYRHQKIKPHAFLNHQYTNTNQTLQNLVRSYQLIEPSKSDSGVYIEAIHDINDFILTTGLRYDYFKMETHDGATASGGKFNPSFGLIYEATDNLSFSISHNYASRSPRLYDALMTHGRRGIVSIKEGTKAERARNTEIGLNYENDNFSISANYFWQKIDDAIINPLDRHQGAVTEIANAGHIKNRGYEINLSYQYEGFNTYLGVTQSKPKFYTSVNTANAEFGAPVGRTWTLGASYRFKQPDVELGWRNRNAEGTNDSIFINGTPARRPGYGVHDFYVNWKPFKDDSMNLNFSINNAFDKYYYPHSQRGETMPGAGRSVLLGFNYTF